MAVCLPTPLARSSAWVRFASHLESTAGLTGSWPFGVIVEADFCGGWRCVRVGVICLVISGMLHWRRLLVRRGDIVGIVTILLPLLWGTVGVLGWLLLLLRRRRWWRQAMSGNVADWGEIGILLRNLDRFLQTRINITGLGLRDGIREPLGIHVWNQKWVSWNRSKLADSPRRCGRRYLPPISRSRQQRRFPLSTLDIGSNSFNPLLDSSCRERAEIHGNHCSVSD